MEPHHHIHISTPALFFIVVLILGLVALLIWAFKKPTPKVVYRGMYGEDYPSGVQPTQPWPTRTTTYSPRYSSNPSYSAPAPTQTSGGGGSTALGFLGGMLVGEALEGRGNQGSVTNIYEGHGGSSGGGGASASWDSSSPTSDYSSTSTSSSSSSYDSGVSYDSSPSSFDSSPSSGVDISW